MKQLLWLCLLSSAHTPPATGQGLQIDDIKPINLGASSVYQSFTQQYGASKNWKSAWKQNSKEVCSKASGSLCASNSNNELSESYFKLLMAASPATFNNRDPSYTGGVDVVKPPKDQHPCNACVGFAAISAAETALAVVLQKSARNISLSVQDLQFCSSGAPRSCRTGWELEPALKELQNRWEVLTDYCLPYAPDVRVEKARADLCRKQCSNADPDASKGQFSYVPITELWHAQRLIRDFGNVVTPFHLTKEFRDFFGNPANKNKVYKPGPNTHFEEGHAVVLVGYNNEEEYWVVKNSWGPDWADGGFFKVAYGTSGILDGSKAFGVTWEPASPSRAPIVGDIDAANPACKIYVAGKGDYISKVAKMFNVELEALLLDNQQVILDLDEPLEGKRLRLCKPANTTLNFPQNSTKSTACVASKQAFILKHGMTEFQYRDEYTRAEKQNMRVATVSGYGMNGKPYYAALFVGKLPANRRHVWGQSKKAHIEFRVDVDWEDLCPSWVNTFTINDTDYYNSMWEKPAIGCPDDNIVALEVVGEKAFQDDYDNNTKEGFQPFWVSGYGSKDPKFATIWKKRYREPYKDVRMVITRGAGLQQQINYHLTRGWQPVLINGNGINNTSWYGAIFSPVGDGARNTFRYGMTESEYQNHKDQQTCAGYTPVHISA
eukprot:jgi/Chrzof1/868/Cz01g32030.t1